MVELMVCEDKVSLQYRVDRVDRPINPMHGQAFQLVDKGPFRRLITYLRPSLVDKDIPHRKKLRKEILQRAAVAEEALKQRLKVCLSTPLIFHSSLTQ